MPPAIAEHLAEAETRVLADLRSLIGTAWARAADLAAHRVADEVAAARKRGSDLEAELAEAANVLDASDEQVELLKADITKVQGILSAAEERHAEAGIALRTTEARLEEVRASLAAAERRADVADARLADMLAALRPAPTPAGV